MDLPTIAILAEAFAVIVAVVFGMVQLRQLNAQRRREAAFALMQSIQSPQMLRGILIIDRLQDAPTKAEFDALPENDQVDVTALLATWESLGILVFNHEIPLQMVDDFYSGTLAQILAETSALRRGAARGDGAPDALGVVSMAGRTKAGKGIGRATCPRPRSASQMDAAFLSLRGRSYGDLVTHGQTPEIQKSHTPRSQRNRRPSRADRNGPRDIPQSGTPALLDSVRIGGFHLALPYYWPGRFRTDHGRLHAGKTLY
jgi:hypothetical protein